MKRKPENHCVSQVSQVFATFGRINCIYAGHLDSPKSYENLRNLRKHSGFQVFALSKLEKPEETICFPRFSLSFYTKIKKKLCFRRFSLQFGFKNQRKPEKT